VSSFLGAGFGGLYAALEFGKRRDPNFEAKLVSQELLSVHADAPRGSSERPRFDAHCQSDPQNVATGLLLRGEIQSIELRNHLIEHPEEADNECAADDRGELLTFVVAGGGFARVETIGSINDFIKRGS
jgi:NADH dehydrogenase FAD-containing subunit